MHPTSLGGQDATNHNSKIDHSCLQCTSDLITGTSLDHNCDVKGNVKNEESRLSENSQEETENIECVCDKQDIRDFCEKDCKGSIENSKQENVHDLGLSFASGGLNIDEKKEKDNTKYNISQNLMEEQIKTADWLSSPPINRLQVRFTETAEKQMKNFSKSSEDPDFRLIYLSSPEEVQQTICQILQEDPRSVYRRQNCCDNLYYFVVDTVHVTCWFDETITEVVRVKPVSLVKHLQETSRQCYVYHLP